MSDADLQGGDWNEAIAEASEHVQERGHAAEEAAAKQKPRSQGPIVAALSIALIVVGFWNVRALSKPPADIPIQEEEHLTWFVTDAVETIEDFQADEGRLPTADEAAELLEDDVEYAIHGETYSLTLVGDEGMTMTYESSTPLNDWMIHQAANMGGL